MALAVSAVSLVFGSGVANDAAAQQDSLPYKPSPQVASTLEPKAAEILTAASEALAKARTMSFTATATYERAANNGQPLYYSSINQVTLERPNKLRVITPGDGTPDEVYYDGKNLTAYIPGANLVAVAAAPPTIDQLVDFAWEKAAIYFPFADVLSSDPYGELSKVLKSAFYVGRSIAVGGVTTDMVAIASDEAAGEIWIGVEDHLPRMIRVVYANEPAHARYETRFSNWKTGEAYDDKTFVTEKAASAKHIEFEAPGDAKPPAGIQSLKK